MVLCCTTNVSMVPIQEPPPQDRPPKYCPPGPFVNALTTELTTCKSVEVPKVENVKVT